MQSPVCHLRLSLAIAAALASPLVHAQDATADQAPARQQSATNLDTVVVSGTAQFKGLRKRDTSFSITTATAEQMREAVPQSTADLLKVTPGVWAEPSGGGTARHAVGRRCAVRDHAAGWLAAVPAADAVVP
jgi:outer membrane receptor protein involved in Fe transport